MKHSLLLLRIEGKKVKRGMIFVIVSMLLFATGVQAKQGDNGYVGGISSGETSGSKYFDYQEVVFIAGEPILFSGQVLVKRSEKSDSETITYRYDLTHGEEDKLTRTVIYTTEITNTNDQIIKDTVLKSKPTEKITIDGKTYSLDDDSNVDFSMSTITDDRPAADYFAGNWNGKKVYIGSDDERITLTSTGSLYGYDQYWGSAETEEILMYIECESGTDDEEDNWGGTVNIKISSTSTQALIYETNRPNEISFEGGYRQRKENNSVLTYTAKLPEFDSDGIATDRKETYTDSISQENYPQQTRLYVPNLKQIKGHWSEEDVKQLYSLEILDNPSNFKPNQYMTRAEFAKAIVLAGKIPVEEDTGKKVNPRLKKNTDDEQGLPYSDVPENHPYYKYIEALYNTGVMTGVGEQRFHPDDIINRAQAFTIFIRVLGFEGLAPNPTGITYFRDNDDIPDWARNSINVASYISLVEGDDYGYLNPNEPMTKAEAAVVLNRLVEYLRQGIVREYRDRVLMY